MRFDLDLGIRTLLAVVLVCAAVAKLRGRAALAGFRASLDELSWLPPSVRPLIAVAVPVAELCVAALFGVPGAVAGRLAYAGSAGLLAAFTLAYGVPMLRGRRIQCACFGAKAESPMSVGHLVLNILLAAAALVGLAAGTDFAYGDVRPAHAVVACGVAGFAALIVVRWEDLEFLLRGPAERRP